MVRPYPQKFGNEDKLIQAQYWYDIGGWGISPDMLILTGFWPQSVMNQLKDDNVDASQAVEQIFGGVLRFRVPPGKKGRDELRQVLEDLNRILQLKRYTEQTMENIKRLLKEEWHYNDTDLLPDKLEQTIKDRINVQKKYVISEDAATVRTLLRLYADLNGIKNNTGYYPGIYARANTMFQSMVIEVVSFAQNNLALKDVKEPAYVELENVAEMMAEQQSEGITP